MGTPPTLTSEQLAKSAERKAAKLAKKAALADSNAGPSVEQQAEFERRKFLKRDWTDLKREDVAVGRDQRVRIVTWNLLAQTLVRRKLFPGSDCLRWSDRKPLLLGELAHHAAADIICLQECDRLKDFLPSLPRHAHVKGSGPGKLHGLVILYKSDRFMVRASKLVHLDWEDLVPAPSSSSAAASSNGDSDDIGGSRKGGSRQTKNVGLIVALQDIEDPSRGIVVATTHLFWHPKYAYERVRQCTILLRNIRQFQSDNECTAWPAVFAGDLNTQPSEATYQLLTSPHTPLPQIMIDEINESRVVHDSAAKISPPSTLLPIPSMSDPNSAAASTSGTGTNTPNPIVGKDDDDEGEGEGEGDEGKEDDTGLPNTRQPSSKDGILPAAQLIELIQSVNHGGAQSAYGSTAWKSLIEKSETFSQRGGYEAFSGNAKADIGGQGRNEPAYTCFTPLFKLTLDYLLLLPPHTNECASDTSSDAPRPAKFTGVLSPPKAFDLGEGLPRKGICASDHLAVGCELEW